MSLLILEGPDGAGKTTLKNALLELQTSVGPDVSRTVHHGAYLGCEDLYQKYLRPLIRQRVEQRFGDTRWVIWERSWLAEPIYGHVMRGGADRIEPWQRRMLERLALGLGAVVVYCLPPADACVAAWAKRREREYPDAETKLRDIHRTYEIAAHGGTRHALPRLTYDHTQDAPERLLERVLTTGVGNPGPGLGCWDASVLLVGDEMSRPRLARSGVSFPFISKNRAGCSAWLAERLEEHDVDERSLYWVNQAEVDEDFIRDMSRFKTIAALGQNADEWLRNVPVVRGHNFFAHPQYHKRFHYNDPYPLLGGLRHATRS